MIQWSTFDLSMLAAAVTSLRIEWLALLLAAAAVVLLLLLRVWRSIVAVRGSAGPTILVDGSNVMHWDRDTPSLDPLLALLRELKQRGQAPGVIFDANAGYKIGTRYMHDGELARLLGLSERQVMVVPKGTQADSFILHAAREMRACIVTNDRYRDWEQSYPEVRRPGFPAPRRVPERGTLA